MAVESPGSGAPGSIAHGILRHQGAVLPCGVFLALLETTHLRGKEAVIVLS